MMNSNIFEKANVLVNNAENVVIALIDENDYPSASTVSRVKSDGIFTIYLATGLDTNKTKRIKKSAKASLCFIEGGNNVTLVGDAEILTDQKTKSDLWQDWFSNYFPKGEIDPNYCIIKVTTKRVSLWIDCESAEGTIASLLIPSSRCGLMCHECEWKESQGCGGCIETNGHPFHGECPIAICCQNKGFMHCGECNDMPCEQLHLYSCGDDEHCDKPKGARLSVLRYWGNEKNTR